ncbi:formate dehydrogenase subunit gamma [Wolinella succinogenes]|uniref:formate dehydrogenase subunit gamma n=1 Tax=Wolinella succinogenes TaxID=844 RepID=UPI00169D5732|nr:cytochrome b/b6 domain-containing protein [Wolinella succinogenes]NLU33346.1 cytochrome b/b6 domain-containing protein [Wolinella succinogenes]
MKVNRQSLSNRVVHWLTALSIFWLIVTGVGQMPVYKRYFVTEIPGFSFLGNYFTTLNQHYMAGAILIAVGFYHLFYHAMRREFDILPRRGDVRASIAVIKAMLKGEPEPPSEKYLPEQRLAYAFIALTILLMGVSGIMKSWKNLTGNELSDFWLYWAATLHNAGMMLLIFGIIAHLAAFWLKPNRKLLGGMVHGKVEAHYVLERHGKWKEGIKRAQKALEREA